MYDYLIVGAGLFGATFANVMTKRCGKKCLVIEARDHVGGNCYTRLQKGIDVHVYGPHIFHTSNTDVWTYVNSFAKFNPFTNRVKSVGADGKMYSMPVCLATMYQLWGTKTPSEAMEKIEKVRVKTTHAPTNLEEWLLSQVGHELYEVLFKDYTKKQWGREPSQVPAFVAKRLPIRFTWNDDYYDDTFQGIPEHGYTAMIETMLQGSDVMLSVDYLANKSLLDRLAHKTLYTGKIDACYNYCYGELQYRSCAFEHDHVEVTDYQGNAIVNNASSLTTYTRSIEHKHFNVNRVSPTTIVTKEYPCAHVKDKNEPMYPINDELNTRLYEKYKMLADSEKRMLFGGRLGTYKYYDMDDTIEAALKLASGV